MARLGRDVARALTSAARSAIAAGAVGVIIGAAAGTPWVALARQSGPTSPARPRVVIPFLASVEKPADLGFEGAECDVDAGGKRMTCEFQQVFLTTSTVAPGTCLVTTNSYGRSFQKDTSSRWVSREGPTGACGTIDVATLRDEGGVRWTMETRRVVTRKDAAPECKNIDERPETMSWQNIRRPLPCTFVQPGGLGR